MCWCEDEKLEELNLDSETNLGLVTYRIIFFMIYVLSKDIV